jgi:hypothetical protein
LFAMMTNEYALNIARLRFAARLRDVAGAGPHRVPSGGSDRGGDAGRHAVSGPNAMGGHHVT